MRLITPLWSLYQGKKSCPSAIKRNINAFYLDPENMSFFYADSHVHSSSTSELKTSIDDETMQWQKSR